MNAAGVHLEGPWSLEEKARATLLNPAAFGFTFNSLRENQFLHPHAH